MSLDKFVVFGLTLVLVYTLFYLSKGKKIASLIGLGTIVVCLTVSVAGVQYFSNDGFRRFVDLNFNPVAEHMIYSNSQTPLPLPAKSTFSYRWAENGCTYFTERVSSDITNYYRDLGAVSNVTEQEQVTEFNLVYGGYRYHITVRPADSGKGSYLSVENLE